MYTLKDFENLNRFGFTGKLDSQNIASVEKFARKTYTFEIWRSIVVVLDLNFSDFEKGFPHRVCVALMENPRSDEFMDRTYPA